MSSPAPASKAIVARELASDARRWELPDMVNIGTGPDDVRGPRTVRQFEEVEQRARDDGFERGLSEGREAARAEMIERIACIDAIVAEMQVPLSAIEADVERELVLLASIAAERIVRHELQTAPELILGAVRAALAALPSHARQIRIHLHAQDAALVREQLLPGEGGHAWGVVEDASLMRGGCRIQADGSHVDATLEARLASVIDSVLGSGGEVRASGKIE